jgi:hypothetical protein
MSAFQCRLFAVLLAATLCASCNRAPSFDVLGSFFPAWMFCLVIGLLLTAVSHWVLARVRVPLAIPVLTYPSLTAFFTFAVWLSLFK